MDKEQLALTLENHKRWLNEDCEGWETMRADLRYVNLSGTDLSGTDLRRADLRRANLSDTDLRRADLRGTDLRRADLSGTDLRDTDLRRANLRGTDLRRADLSGTDLSGAKIDENTKTHVPYACPEFGSFIGWKKASGKIVCLEILEDAIRCSATTRKCRCSKAKVLNITNLDGTETDLTEVASSYDKSFIYKIGEIVEVKDFNMDRWQECSEGIHFFITRREAVEW